jgi:16S rRNA (guanine966-N2)-methyltransferase
VLRIVGGEFKGRKLLALPKGIEGVRPSSSRVRGAIFDRLQGEVVDARVLDLFAGSGALSFEALSRGAAFAQLVERARPLQRHIERQIAELSLGARARLSKSSAQALVGGPAGEPFDLVFIDPPYADLDAYQAVLEGLVSGGWLAPEAVIVVERARRAQLPAWPEVLREEAEKRHGDSLLHFLRAP